MFDAIVVTLTNGGRYVCVVGGGFVGLTNWHILCCLQDVAIFEWSSVTWKYFCSEINTFSSDCPAKNVQMKLLQLKV